MTLGVRANHPAPCEGVLRLAGRVDRTTLVAAREASRESEAPRRRVERGTAAATPAAPAGPWRESLRTRHSRGSLSAPETTRRGAEREPHSTAAGLSRLQGAEESAAAAITNPPAERSAGRGAGPASRRRFEPRRRGVTEKKESA